MRLLKWIPALLFGASLIIVFWQARAINLLEARPPAYKSDGIVIDAAIRLWNEKSKEPVDWIKDHRYPVVVHMGGSTCVELRLVLGSVGGNPSYCFSNANNQLIVKNDEVE